MKVLESELRSPGRLVKVVHPFPHVSSPLYSFSSSNVSSLFSFLKKNFFKHMLCKSNSGLWPCRHSILLAEISLQFPSSGFKENTCCPCYMPSMLCLVQLNALTLTLISATRYRYCCLCLARKISEPKGDSSFKTKDHYNLSGGCQLGKTALGTRSPGTVHTVSK